MGMRKTLIPILVMFFTLISCSSNSEVKLDNNIYNNNSDYTFIKASESTNRNETTTQEREISYYLDNSIQFKYVKDNPYKFLNLSTNKFVSISFTNAKYYSNNICIDNFNGFNDGDIFKVYYEETLMTYPEILIALYVFID